MRYAKRNILMYLCLSTHFLKLLVLFRVMGDLEPMGTTQVVMPTHHRGDTLTHGHFGNSS